MTAGVFSAENVSAQGKETIENAEAAFALNDWMTAAKELKQLVSSNPENPVYHSQLGYSYLQLGKKDMAMTELKKAKDLYSQAKKVAKIPSQTNEYYLGSAQRQSGDIDGALKTLNDLKPQVSGNLASKVEQEIKSCEFAKQMKSNPKDMTVLNLGKFVNDASDDHTPVVSPDGKTLYFTSRKKIDGHSTQEDGGYDENIYASKLSGSTGTWSAPEILPESINTNANVAVACLSPDGNELYIYRDDKNGTLLVSKKSGSSWGEPVELNQNINTDYRETGASLSRDGNKLYFASNRPGGLGGLDLYVSERINGDWGPAINLGKEINSELEEDAPFIAPDGSLYFSSTGHTNLGGYDIFKASANGNKFSAPENLGAPVNSEYDEIFPFFGKDNKMYFASDRKNGIGEADLYVAGSKSQMATAETVLTGKVSHCDTPIPANKILIRDHSTGTDSEVTPAGDGSYEIKTFRGHNYSVSFELGNSTVHDSLFDVAVNAPASQKYKDVKLDGNAVCPVVADNNDDGKNKNLDPKPAGDNSYVVEINDIKFPFAKADAIQNNADLDKLAKYLKDNKKAKVQIAGYCDAMGDAKLNKNLAQQRARAAYNYLTKKGVKASQLSIAAFGEENPVAYNKINGEFNEDSKQFNRRLEFEVLQQGEKQTLVINPVRNVPQKYKNPDYKQTGYTKASGDPETER